MATLLELAKIKHHAVRSDGAKFLDGERNDSLNTSWLSVNGGLITLGPGLYDELLVVKGEVSDDQIKAWASMGAPFYDPTPQIPDEQIQSAEYWSGPVDASKRPVYTLGAGADIEMDKFGIRATRKADNVETFRVDTETGSAFFKGDITGASGTFTGPVKSVDAEGNYSLLDSARVQFFRKIGEDVVPSYYVAQIATGQAVHGEVVDLATLGYRFFEAPKIVLQPKFNRVFVANTTTRDVWMDWGVDNQTFDAATGAATFEIRCRTIIKGGEVIGNFSPNQLEIVNTSTTTTTGPGTTFLQFQIGGRAVGGMIGANARIVFRIHYRKSGDTNWTLLDGQVHSRWSGVNFLKTYTYNVPTSGSVGYQVRVTLSELKSASSDSETPHIKIHEFKYRAGDTILQDPNVPESVSWIAIDGG